MVMGVFLLCLAGTADATLMTIGTATYNGSDYKLIWDDDNNGNSVVWLDYTNSYGTWYKQSAWAAGLGASLTVNLNSGYAVIWDDPNWRLPSTVDGPHVHGYDGSLSGGFNITTSEMGHLFYEELGNLGLFGTDGSYQPGYGLTNTGDFNNLLLWEYWSCTGAEYRRDPAYAWVFNMAVGSQGTVYKSQSNAYGLALRGGQVDGQVAAPTPIPAPVLLLSTGLLGLIPMIRRKKGSRCR